MCSTPGIDSTMIFAQQLIMGITRDLKGAAVSLESHPVTG